MMNSWVAYGRIAALALLVSAIILGPSIAPYSPTVAEPRYQNSSPDSNHLLGRDGLGRDLLSRLLWGTPITLGSAFLASLIAIVIGVPSGSLAGLTESLPSRLILHIVDFWLAFPGLIVALLVVTWLGPGYAQLSLASGLSLAPSVARLIRSKVIEIRSWTFIEASRALGADGWWWSRFHLARNMTGEVVAYASIMLAWSIMNIAALDFIGLGGDPAIPGWGRMMFEGRTYLREAPLGFLAPGIAIVLGISIVIGIRRDWPSVLGQLKG